MNFNQDLNSWNVSSVTNMWAVFLGCKNFNQPLNNWNISSANKTENMFHSTEKFNQDISEWDMSNVTDMGGMFYYATAFNQDISGWDVSKVTDYVDYGTNASLMPNKFQENNLYGYFKYILDDSTLTNAVSSWDTDSTNAEQTYGPISNWNVSQVTSMSNLFKDKSFNEDISGWDVSKVSAMNGMFRNSTFNQDISGWTVSNVVDMSYMFQANSSFNQNLSSWTTTEVQNLSYMFQSATAFNGQIDGWDTSKVITIERMFQGATVFNQPINNWVLSSLTDMNHIFVYAENFNQHLNNWDVSKVTYMRGVFFHAISFNQPLNNWDVSSVTSVRGMFEGANVFNQDISNWNVVNVDENNDAGAWLSFGNTPGHSEPLFRDSNPYYFTIKQTPITDSNIQTAVNDWDENGSNKYKYGHNIATWDTSVVTNMSQLFKDKTNLFGNKINFVNVQNLSVVDSQSYMTTNFGNISPQFTMNGAAPPQGDEIVIIDGASNQMYKDTQYGPPSDGINIWGAAVSQTSDPNLGGFKFISDINGICEIRYGAAWIDWSVAVAKISLNGNVIYSTRSTSTIETFTVSIGDEILIYEEYSVLNLYTIYLRRLESNISNWDVSNVTDMTRMFYGVSSFNEPIGNWNVSNVTTLWETFMNATNFNQTLGVNNFGFESDLPANFGIMAHNLIAIGGSNSDTHCSIDAWGLMGDGTIILYNRTSDLHGRFCRIYLAGDTVTGAARYLPYDTPIYNSLTELVNGYNTASSVQNYVYFTKGINFDYITFTNNGWDVSKVTDMNKTFSNASVFNKPLNSWNVSNVTNLNHIFHSALSFNQPIGNWNVSNVTNISGIFYNASAFNQTLGLNNFGTRDDLPANFGSMTIPVHNVTCSVDRWAYYEPNKIIIYNYTEGSHGRFALITMNGTYENNSSRVIVGGGTTVYNTRDELIDDYATAYIAAYSNEHSFESGTGFNNITVTNGWNVSKVTNMGNTFRNTSAFNQPIGSWNVSSVDRMDYTFNSSAFNQPLGNNFGTGDDLPANFGTFGGDHVAINGPVDYWVYDPSDGNIIVAREDSNVLKMIKISQDGTIASVADPIRHGSGNPLPTITSAADLISDFYNPQQAGSHLLYTFTKLGCVQCNNF